jgi:hypothetical protein
MVSLSLLAALVGGEAGVEAAGREVLGREVKVDLRRPP